MIVQPTLDETLRVALVGGPQDGKNPRARPGQLHQHRFGSCRVQRTAFWHRIDRQVAVVIVAKDLLLAWRVEQDRIAWTAQCLKVGGNAPVIVAGIGGIGVVVLQGDEAGGKDQKGREKL